MEWFLNEFETFVGVNLWTMLFAWCNLLILYLVLKKILFKPIKNMIDSRQTEVDNMYSDAERAKCDAAALKSEYEEIKKRLEERMNAGKISEYTKCTIVDMSNRVLEHIALNYENVREGVKEVMGGRVLDYEAKDIRNGRSKEIAENMIKKGKLSFEDIAEYAGMTVSEVEKLAEKLGVLTPA